MENRMQAQVAVLKSSNNCEEQCCVVEHSKSHKEEVLRKTDTEELENIKTKVLSLYQDLETFLESDEYIEDLQNELQVTNPDYFTVIRKWRKDFEKSEHGIVVAGETSAGKTTLINKMIRMKLFQRHNIESTSTICKLRHSDTIKIITQSMTGDTKELDFTNTCDITTREGVDFLRNSLKEFTDRTSSEESLKYRSVEIRLPVPFLNFLKGNLALVDTPGIGGSGDSTQRLIEYLPNALAFVFVINVASAGGMQHDRLPEILRAISLLQWENEMPCFDPKDVIFITNKWDSLGHSNDESDEDSSDEHEVTETWNALQIMIRKKWPAVKEDHIFKLNLKRVSSSKENDSKSQFKEFERVLESVVKDAEKTRVRQHLRFMQEIMIYISRGLRTRIGLDQMTEKEHIALFNKQIKMIERLDVECKEIRRILLERKRKTIEEIVKECEDYMSTESGENSILNPEGRIPIAKLFWFSKDFSKEIKQRVDLYVESYLQSDAVVNRFEKIKDELISFSKRTELSLSEMENEWINGASFVLGGDSYSIPFPIVLVSAFIVPSLIVFGLGYSVVAAAAWGLGNTLLNIGITPSFEIKNAYENCKKLVRKELCSHLEKKYGLITSKMIDKITEDIIPKRIDSLMMLIGQTSDKRERYIANQKVLTNLNVRLEEMKENVTKLQNHDNAYLTY